MVDVFLGDRIELPIEARGTYLTRVAELVSTIRLASLRAAWVAHPVTRTRAKARGSISWVRKLALVQRQTAATDASREPRSESLKLRDSLVNSAGPTTRKLGPVLTFGNPTFRELRELYGDLVEGHSNPLGKDNKCNPSKHAPLISTVARAGALGFDQALFFVKTQRRRSHPTAA
jgi:hypothetical protein